MLVKGSDAYNDAAKELGCEGFDVNIPFTYHIANRQTNAYKAATQRVKAQAQVYRMLQISNRMASEHLTTYINRYKVAERMRFGRTNEHEYARAFFFVSTQPIGMTITTPSVLVSAGARVLKVFGGECLQAVRHFHYVVVTEFPVRSKDVRLQSCKHYNVTPVALTVSHAQRYIEAQLVKPPVNWVYTHRNMRVPADYIEWHGRLSNAVKEEKRRHTYVFEGGYLQPLMLMSSVLYRETVSRVRITEKTPFRVEFSCRIRFNVFSRDYECYDKEDNRVRYRGQPLLLFNRPRRHVTDDNRIKQRFPCAHYMVTT